MSIAIVLNLPTVLVVFILNRLHIITQLLSQVEKMKRIKVLVWRP